MDIQLDHGVLHTREKGSGRPFLLLNGFPFGSAEYDDVLEVLSWSSRAIAVDLPGVGASTPLPAPSPEALAKALLYSFATLGIDGIVLAATDVAGPVAVEILRQQPGSIAGILLFNTCISPGGMALPRYLETSRTTVVDLLNPNRRLENEILCVTGKGESLSEEILAKGIQNLKRPARKVGADLFQRMLRAPFEAHQLALQQFRKPLWLLWGERDPLFSRAQYERFRRLLPDAPATLQPDTGHFLGIEEPNILAQTLQDLGKTCWG